MSERFARIDVHELQLPAHATALHRDRAFLALELCTESRPVIDIALQETGWPRDKLVELLDPLTLTRGGSFGGSAGG